MKSCFFGHKWARWSEPVNVGVSTHGTAEFPYFPPIHVDRSVQRRSCERCGKVQVSYDQPVPPPNVKNPGAA